MDEVPLKNLKPTERFKKLGKLIAYPALRKRVRELPARDSDAFFIVCYPLD